jgi:hypothetical protein
MSSLVVGDSLPDLGKELPFGRTGTERSSLCRNVRAFGGTTYWGAHDYFPSTQLLCADTAYWVGMLVARSLGTLIGDYLFALLSSRRSRRVS